MNPDLRATGEVLVLQLRVVARVTGQAAVDLGQPTTNADLASEAADWIEAALGAEAADEPE